MPETRYRWYLDLNRYQWFVLVVAVLGWLFFGRPRKEGYL